MQSHQAFPPFECCFHHRQLRNWCVNCAVEPSKSMSGMFETVQHMMQLPQSCNNATHAHFLQWQLLFAIVIIFCNGDGWQCPNSLVFNFASSFLTKPTALLNLTRIVEIRNLSHSFCSNAMVIVGCQVDHLVQCPHLCQTNNLWQPHFD